LARSSEGIPRIPPPRWRAPGPVSPAARLESPVLRRGLPGLTAARERARLVVCTSNLRTVGVGQHGYGADRWQLRYAYEGQTYNKGFFALRVYGTIDAFGYGPEGARLYAGGALSRLFQ